MTTPQPKKPKLTLEQQIAATEARLSRLKERHKKRSKAEETRRKIIAGALVLNEAAEHPEFARWLSSLLNRSLTRPDERALFPELLTPPQTAQIEHHPQPDQQSIAGVQ